MPKTNYTIYSKNCWIDGALREATILTKGEIISEVFLGKKDEGISENTIDAGDKILMPGVIDAHVHINEPGRTHWEGFETATRAAAAGGITTLVDMPLNSTPVTTTKEALHAKIKAAKGKLSVNCGFYGGIVPGNIDQLEALSKEGVLGIKAFLTHSGIDDFPNVTKADLEKGLKAMANFDIPLLVHCELSKNEKKLKKGLDQNPQSYEAYLDSRPKSWENEAIDLVIKLCKKYKCKAHIVHLSSAEALKSIVKAKKKGLPITVETCPQYLLFVSEGIPEGNTLYKCAPPIREMENNRILKQAIAEGWIDFITTDHSPAPPDLKELESGDFSKAWGGISGLQFLLPASWTALKNHLPLEKFIPLLTEYPAKFLHLSEQRGKIAEGYLADLVIWNPNEKFTVTEKSISHRYKTTPYLNKELYGVVQQTFVNGKLVFDAPGFYHILAGKVILQKRP